MEKPEIGSNRTGIQTSPIDTKKMLETPEGTRLTPGDERHRGTEAETQRQQMQRRQGVGAPPPFSERSREEYERRQGEREPAHGQASGAGRAAR